MLLRDPLDENVIPVVEELQRRLPPANHIVQGQRDGKGYPSGQNDVEAGEEDGLFHYPFPPFLCELIFIRSKKEER